jgi:hypothetical protein
VLLVALCLFGLVTAAFLAPVTGANPPVGGGDGDGGLIADIVREVLQFLMGDRDPADTGDGGDGGGSPPQWLIELLRDLIGDGGGGDGGGDGGDGGDGGEGDGGGGSLPEWLIELLRDIIGGGNGTAEADCRVLVEQNPTPGSETTVQVLEDGDPAPGVRVWFNDRYVGETGEDGAVTGVVPYADRLNVTVQSDATCSFTRAPVVGAADGASAVLLSTALDSPLSSRVASAGVATPLQSTVAASGVSLAPPADGYAQADEGVNSSGEVRVDGTTTVRILGKPYPNSTIELVATAGGTPIPDANVSIDGQRVGQTDADGRYTLTVPDRDRISLTVSREAVTGSTTIEIWQLQLGFVPQLTVPGETVTANVTTPGGPVSNASVTLAGRELGTSAADGRVQFRAPASVDGTIVATTSRQSTTVPLWRVYGVTLGASALLVALSTVSTAAVARRSGRERAKRVAVGWLAVATAFVGFAIWELIGLLGALALIAVLALYVFREWVLDLLVWLAAAATRALWWCQRTVLGIVSWLETVVDTLRALSVRFVAWLRRQPRSVSGLLARLADWLADLPEHLRAAGDSTAVRVVAAAVVALLFVIASTVLFRAVGLVLSMALVLVAVVGWLALRYRDDSASGPESSAPVATSTANQPLGADVGGLSLRELWRRVAQWVLPSSWRTRTPAEISRAAIDAGLPREPVERLADAFRDVEYGGGSETAHLDEAWAAYESLETEREDDG